MLIEFQIWNQLFQKKSILNIVGPNSVGDRTVRTIQMHLMLLIKEKEQIMG